jgi:uncharacterized protein (DUF427 family)
MTETATAGKSPGFAKAPDYDVHLEPSPRRLRVDFNGATIADTTRAVLMYETGQIPVYYFPFDDIQADLLTPTEQTSFCPFKGQASYWSVVVDGRTSENALWSYPAPFDEVPELAGYAAFYWDRVDHWYEEDEEIFVHPRDPYKRIDVLPSSRKVAVVLGGETVAESGRAHFLFETGMPTRYYMPAEDVRMDLLTRNDTRSGCPYKGEAIYWSATIGGEIYENIAWSYPEPVPECPRVKNLICFFNENVEAITVDGAPVDRPETRWSK